MLRRIFTGRFTSHIGDLVSALQINSYNTQPLATGRREVTDITEMGLCVMHNLQYNASASYNAQLRHGCLPFGEQRKHQTTTSMKNTEEITLRKRSNRDLYTTSLDA